MIAIYLLPIAWVLYTLYTTNRAFQTKVPGPWYTNITSLILKSQEFSGNRRVWIHSLHERYGSVVRLAPNEVSFANLDGLKEIYQSAGSGYDKTEFYDLFKQFEHRTMFSTLNKHEVGALHTPEIMRADVDCSMQNARRCLPIVMQ